MTRIVIAATFTAEPVEESLQFWLSELGFSASIGFAPHDQVFQQLLDPTSMLATNQHGVNVLLIRLEDWQDNPKRACSNPDSPSGADSGMEHAVHTFIGALNTTMERGSSSYIICFCPSGSSGPSNGQPESCYEPMERLIASQLAELPGVQVVSTAELAATYPVAKCHDYHANRLARIPYTPVFYTALATMLARKLYATACTPCKVIVLDCDETLWVGACGEQDAAALRVDDARKFLHEFMKQKHDQGFLICLCSKNNEEDVLDVFARRDDLGLSLAHIAARRINWSPKSANIRSLSQELGLGLDSFILIDDDPVECAEVREHCAEMLTFQLPRASDSIPTFLSHIWSLDNGRITREDESRTALYRQHIRREHSRRETSSLREFLAGLDLQVQISSLSQTHIRRVTELTQRTNQFNLTGVRQMEAEVAQLLHTGGMECLVVHVSDRFGDYGLVGAMVLEVRSDALVVESFLLSCRALGRGVEHCMLAKLGSIAEERGLAEVVLRCVPTAKNKPARDFLESLSECATESWDEGYAVSISVDTATRVSYNPDAACADFALEDKGNNAAATSQSRPTPTLERRCAFLCNIPETLYDPEVIHGEVSQARRRPATERAYAAPRTPVEQTLAQIFSELLGIEEIGIHDSFFAVGGHSLQAMQVLSRVNETLNVELDATLLFTTNFSVVELGEEVLRQQLTQIDSQGMSTVLEQLSELTDDDVALPTDNSRSDRGTS